MNTLKSLKTTLVAGITAILLAATPQAHADLAGSLAREKELAAEVQRLSTKIAQLRQRLMEGDAIDGLAAAVLRDAENEGRQAERKLSHIRAKIAVQRSDAAKEAARMAAQEAARNAARKAAFAAAKAAAAAAAKDASKIASRNSSKDSGRGAAQSAAHPSAPCPPTH